MKLTQLKEAAERAIEYAIECGENPDEIPVTLQIDRDGDDSICSDFEVELHYDNNTCATGCVLTAFLEEDTHTAKGNALLSAAMSLVGKLKIIHASEAYKAVWVSGQHQLGPYKGPQYDKELAALEQAITDEHRRIFPEAFHSENA